MKTFVCSVCGYVHQGDTPTEKCPKYKKTAKVFKEVK